MNRGTRPYITHMYVLKCSDSFMYMCSVYTAYIHHNQKQYLLMLQSYWLIVLSTPFWLNQIDVCIFYEELAISDASTCTWLFLGPVWRSGMPCLHDIYLGEKTVCSSIYLWGHVWMFENCKRENNRPEITMNSITFCCKWTWNYQTAIIRQ